MPAEPSQNHGAGPARENSAHDGRDGDVAIREDAEKLKDEHDRQGRAHGDGVPADVFGNVDHNDYAEWNEAITSPAWVTPLHVHCGFEAVVVRAVAYEADHA